MKSNDANSASIKSYRAKVEKELNDICTDILDLLDSTLIAKAQGSAEASVFYLKMKADYYRYLAEFANDKEKAEHAAKAANSYQEATNQANPGSGGGLPSTHPIRLGLALNYSVFLYAQP